MTSSSTGIRAWLAVVLLLIVAMVAVGGITRLTGSGLSMVEWKPILGTIPPTSESAWQEAFVKYQQFPQYQLLNQDMTLSEFKFIFFWEYLHRLLGRLIGLVYALPFFWFLARGRLTRSLAVQLGVGLVLGGVQGVLGWYMVQSGLVDQPHVSHYRLAAHLGLALLLFAYLTWIFLSLGAARRDAAASVPAGLFRTGSYAFLTLLVLQIIYGAFVAGLKAGYAFNTFPKMLGYWVPPGLAAMQPTWLNLLENPAAIQFIHRGLGWTLFGLSIALWAGSLGRQWDRAILTPTYAVVVLTVAQFLLGIITLVTHVQLVPAVLHQLTACLLLGATVCLAHGLYKFPVGGATEA